MRRRILTQALLSMGLLTTFMILTAPKAYADNCGSLSDCFQTGSSAASVIAGVAVLITIAVLALPSLLETTKSPPTPPEEPDRVPQPPQPPTPPESAPEGSTQYPEFPPAHLAGGAMGVLPARDKEHPDDHPPERPGEHPPEDSTVPHPEEPTVHASEQPGVQAPDQHPEHSQASSQHPEHKQAPDYHPEHLQAPSQHPEHLQTPNYHPEHQQARPPVPPYQHPQTPHPDEHTQVARPGERVSLPRTPMTQPPASSLLYGIHHVTAIAGNPQQNIEFYTSLLGLRLVKQTVNIDNPTTYHLYYGDELGRPGTILSFFAWPGAFRGSRGSGQAVAVALSIPAGALNYWAEYLSRAGIRLVQPPTHFDEQAFSFYDPDGLQIVMVAHRDTGLYPTQSSGPIPPAYAIRGIYGVTLLEANYERTHAFLTQVLGSRQVKAQGNHIRYEVGGGGPGTFLDILNFPGIPPSQAALGTIHHLAWRTPEDEQQLVLQQKLTSLGINLAQGVDPLYFPAYSFREPSGVLFEIAGLLPGFTIDEPPEQLGTHLMLPPWLANRRAELQQALPPLRLPFAGR